MDGDRNLVPLSMVSVKRLWAVISASKYLVENDIDGDMVECGVWRGGCSIAIAKTLKNEKGWATGLKDVIKNWFLVLRCSTLGCLVGALPGLGGTVVDWIAYSHLKQTTKDTSQFGKGDIRGVIAPEAANNAKEGGALIPTLIFGIPGSGNKVLLLGGFVLIGIEPD